MILTGIARLGRDADLRYTADGTSVVNLSLAFNYGKKDGSGEKPTQWVDASLWGKRAETLVEYLTKGTLVSVVLTEPHIEAFEGKNGAGHKLVARVSDLEFAGGKRDQAQDSKPVTPGTSAKDYSKQSGSTAPRGNFDDMDDDFPF